MSEDRPTIGFVGAGVLGSAIIERLLTCGFELKAWNRSRDKLAPLLELGASAAETPADLARESDVVITCVTDHRAVESVVFGPDGVASAGVSGKLLIDMSTSNTGKTREMADRLEQTCGMGWVDAPISGGAPAARTGSMAVMCGGSEANFALAEPVLRHLAGALTLMGPVGAGQGTKMINQVLVSCSLAVLAEACALAERAGVDALRIPEALAGGRADSRLLQEFLPKMAKSDFSIEGSVSIMLKDLEMIHDLAETTGAVMPVTALVTQINRQLVLYGLADADNSTIVNLYREGGLARIQGLGK
jgi:3-hydroxyisobutyrate dehydrogenase-like beta-hydroxyacid dehydrogenase